VATRAQALSSSTSGATSSGEILNLMQTDGSRISELVTYLHVVWCDRCVCACAASALPLASL
jgi:hypothetical protein